jgi:hypothetical protein
VAGEGFEPSKVWGFTVPSHGPLGQPTKVKEVRSLDSENSDRF